MKKLYKFWLSQLCSMVRGAKHGVIYLVEPENSTYNPVCSWPHGFTDYASLTDVVALVIAENKSIGRQCSNTLQKTGEPLDIVACPLFHDDQLAAVVCVEITGRSVALQQLVIRQIEWAAIWLTAMKKQQGSIAQKKLVNLVELVAASLEHKHFQSAATEVVTEIARQFSCERVSIGFLYGRTLRIEAISNSATFDRQTDLSRKISDCLDEALDQAESVVFPAPKGHLSITRNHELFSKAHGKAALCTMPFVHNKKLAGALMFERPAEQRFTADTVEQLGHLSAIVGPVLEVRRRDERLPIEKLREQIRLFFAKIFGTQRLALKVAVLTCIAVVTYCTVVSDDYRVTAAARLEAESQRIVVAPIQGFIARADAKAGDIVKSGEELGALEDKELLLEHQKWSSKLEQYRKQYRNALALQQRSKRNIIGAQIHQAQAQLQLVEQQLARTRLISPLSGLVVSGDLSQSLGAPVERGQVLFTVAPMGLYRVVLEVDERDIGEMQSEQKGHLVLTSLPGELVPVTVKKITPISNARDGRNFFRVEASLNYSSDLLRPGMEGIAKIEIDKREKIWIMTHKLLDWLRLRTWSFRW